jgi:hypothetical protein
MDSAKMADNQIEFPSKQTTMLWRNFAILQFAGFSEMMH